MVSASYMGMGLYDSHCKGSNILSHTGKGERICSICEKEVILDKHWYGSKWVVKGDKNDL